MQSLSEMLATENKIDWAYIRINRERRRAAEVHGFTGEYDDRMNSGGQLLLAAVCYYGHALGLRPFMGAVPRSWPFAGSAWTPYTPDSDLVRAGALCMAEIERRDRFKLASGPAQHLLDNIARRLLELG